MVVKKFMVTESVTLAPNDSFKKAINIVQDKGIRHLPVIDDGNVVGIVTDRDLGKASPSSATSLSVFELNYLLASITIGDIMTKDPITIDANAPVEEAAKLIDEHKIGALPVTEKGRYVGLITKSDVVHTFVEIMGLGVPSVRYEIDLENRPGALMETLKVIRDNGGYIVSVLTFQEKIAGRRTAVFRVRVDDEDTLSQALRNHGAPILVVCDVCRLD